MANSYSTANMSLILPTPTVDPGPDWANNINASFTILDGHTHSSGSGVQITPSGLNINVSLPMNGQSLTAIGALTFQSLSADAISNSLYEKDVDLYYCDGNNNVIRITQSGSVSGASGTITGLPSGTASASFAGGTFTFQSATSTGANLDGASLILRNNTASSFGLTLQPPSALGGNYSLTLPSIPAQTNVVTLDTSGNMGSSTWDQVGQNMTSTGANAVANTRTRATGTTVAVGGVAISSSSGNFAAGSSATQVTNLSVTITTSGRPVQLIIQPDGTGSLSTFETGSGVFMSLFFYRAGSQISVTKLENLGATTFFPGYFSYVDPVAAGTYTYAVYASSSTGSNAFVNFVKLLAYEI